MEENELVASKEILDELFNEEEKVVMYRAHFEIEKAKKKKENEASGSGATTHATNEGYYISF